MSRPRDAQATRATILEAAAAEFTACGLAGARVESIAARAGVNKALLYHYFADKESLFQHVLECKMHRLTSIDLDPARAAEIAGELFDFYAANPDLMRLMMWEALDIGIGRVPGEEERAARFAEHVARVEEAQRAGTVDPSLDARHTLITLISTISAWFAFPQIARLLGGEDPYTPKALARRRAHIVDIARRIIDERTEK
ncbi:MAG: TetR family transcriptional regulator [Actinomycetota bacterium]